MFENQKHAFWQALFIAIFIFGIGIFLGFLLEDYRVGKVAGLYAQSELNFLDIRIQSELFGLENLDCKIIHTENVNFADKIYEEAKLLERYESASRITESIKLQHKKYDLLRALLWVNSIKIESICKKQFSTLVYFYKYNEPTIEEKAKQSVFSKQLEEIKKNQREKVILIPIAGDNNISSVNSLMKAYNISSFPLILVNEKYRITEISELQSIKGYLK